MVVLTTILDISAGQFEFIEYEISDGQVVHITGFNKNLRGSVSLPDTIENLPVTTIDQDAFRGWSISELNLPDGLRVIGSNAFAECQNLLRITIPRRVMAISINAFDLCEKLRQIDVDERNIFYKSVDGVLLSKYRNRYTLIKYPSGKLTSSYEVPDFVSFIQSKAFEKCKYLEKVKISWSVEALQELAFTDCQILTSITIDNHWTTGYNYTGAFNNLPALESFTITKRAYSRAIASDIGGSVYEIYPWGWHVLPSIDDQPQTTSSIRMAPVIMVQGEEGSVKTIEVADSPDGPWRFWMDVTATESGVAITDLDGQANKRFYRVVD
jgi:hypothetical protein